MSEENLRSESSRDATGAEKTTQETEPSLASTELAERRIKDPIDETRKEVREFNRMHQLGAVFARQTGRGLLGRSQFVKWSFVDASGNPIEESSAGDLSQGPIDTSGEDLNVITISESEFDQLSEKTAEILQEASLAFERIGKDQDEIEQLKTETRAMLARLRAA